MLTLRAKSPDDLALPTGGDSPFDDFGPEPVRDAPAPSDLDGDGRLTVVDDDGEVAGVVSWRWSQWGPNAASRCAMIGVWLRPQSRGRGIGTRAQRELVGLLFTHTTTYRVEAATDVDNLAEQRALERVGLRQEGRARACQWRLGGYHDNYLYAILRPEWSAGLPDGDAPTGTGG